jgi:hypothetical protein
MRISFGWAWISLAAALALHVWDEAAHDFLGVYNPTVQSIRERLPFLPLPTFTYNAWLAGLIAGVALLLVLSYWAFRNARRLRIAGCVLATLMLLNGLGHFAGSLYMRDWMPGVYSSPFLIAASLAVLAAARR